jgi:probable blue pigment (indigoidine) exporter
VLYLAVVGSVVTFLVYFTLLKSWNVTSLSFLSVFTPIVALALGFVVLKERPSAWVALGAAIILGGVLLTVTEKRRTSVGAPEPSGENA